MPHLQRKLRNTGKETQGSGWSWERVLGTVHLLWLKVEVARSVWNKTLVASSALWSMCNSSAALPPLTPAHPLTLHTVGSSWDSDHAWTPARSISYPGIPLPYPAGCLHVQTTVECMCVPCADTRSNDGWDEGCLQLSGVRRGRAKEELCACVAWGWSVARRSQLPASCAAMAAWPLGWGVR